MKIAVISLGCAKNRIDSELFLGLASKYGLDINANYNLIELVDQSDLESADIIVINTCGFIESAKKESLDTIFEMLDYQKQGKKIAVMGCLVERYLDELKKEIPEVDYFLPIRSYPELFKFFKKLTNSDKQYSFYDADRFLSTPSKCAYIRIGEGCDNCCTYCAIPLIRGKYHSRNMDDILTESVNGSGYNEKYGLLGSNKATEETVKLFPRAGQELVEEIQVQMLKRTGKHVEVMVHLEFRVTLL